MRRIILAMVCAGTALAAVSSADASGGCGPAFHRGPYGHCRPNGGPVFVGPGGLAVGVFHPGRGYWDGRRYWRHREHWRGGWRYR